MSSPVSAKLHHLCKAMWLATLLLPCRGENGEHSPGLRDQPGLCWWEVAWEQAQDTGWFGSHSIQIASSL